MRKWKRAVAMGLTAMLALAGCGGKDASQPAATDGDGSATAAADAGNSGSGANGTGNNTANDTIDKVVWFSDVDFWNPPSKWDTSEDTITGGITKATGLEFEMNIPAGDGSTKLALMIVNGNLPDIMSLTDSTTIKELVDSGQVWQMEEFLQTYDPESHLLNGGYAEDIKQNLIERDGDWYAYVNTGLTAWWPFHNSDFFNHVDPAPEEGTEDYLGMLNQTALGRLEETTVYNAALISFSDSLIDPSSDVGISKSQIDNYLPAQISTIVMTKDDASFEAEYNAMLEQLDKLGIEELNRVYNEAYKEKCDYYGETLTNCNKDRH